MSEANQDASIEPGRRRRQRRTFAALLVLILLGALAVRAVPLGVGLPYPAYVDEQDTLRPAAQMIAGPTWDPGAYNYPPLTMYATVALAGVFDLRPGGGRLGADARSTIHQPIESRIDSTETIVAGRLFVLLCSVGTVLVSALLATRLWGRRAGIVTALVTATMPALVTRGAIVVVDTPAAFFATCSLLCASSVRSSRHRAWWAVAAGASAGLAAAAKYPSVAVILAALIVIALDRPRPAKPRLALMGISLAACVGAAVLAAPTLALRTGRVLDELERQSHIYANTATSSYWHDLLLGREVGPVLLVLAAVGGVLLVRSARTRPLMYGYVAFAVALLAQIARYPYQPFRNILPLLPFLGIAASVGIVAAADTLAKSRQTSGPTRAGLIGVAGVGLCGLMVVSGARRYIDTRIDITDSRVQTRQWLLTHVHPGAHVLVAAELAIPPSELDRIPAHVTVHPLAMKLTRRQTASFDYVVVGDRSTSAKWRAGLRDRKTVTHFGQTYTQVNPRSYRPQQQIIRVFAPPGTQDPRSCFPFCG